MPPTKKFSRSATGPTRLPIMASNLFFWNVHKEQDKHHPFPNWLSSNKPVLGAILESYIKEPNIYTIMQHIFPGWKFTSNHNTDNDRRIIIIRKDTVNVQVMHQSRQAITCNVTIPGDHRFMFTAVYISNQRGERKLLLENLDW